MKVSFKTLGCRLNQYDTEWLREEFEFAGFQTVEQNPDICIVNTCAVTSKAGREARKSIRSFAKDAFVIVTGCGVASDYQKISLINGVQVLEPDPRKVATRFLNAPLLPGISSFNGHNKAFIKIQEGCDQFCTYCIVPYTRGKPRQRPKEEILAEIRNLVHNGYKEFILTGTNISKYNGFLDLIESIEKIDGVHPVRKFLSNRVHRLGIGSIEPFGISDEILDFIQSSRKFSRYFHIPLQSGDPKVLKLMNRWYGPEEYSELVHRIKERMPDSAIGADVIVGFPGEGEQEFMNTYDLISRIPISRLHVFRYSRRPWIKALELKGEPAEKVKKQRSELLRKLGEKKWENFRKQFVGKAMESHIEGVGADYNLPLHDGWKVGVTSNYIKVLFKSTMDSEFINLRIKEIDGPKTYGEVVEMRDECLHEGV